MKCDSGVHRWECSLDEMLVESSFADTLSAPAHNGPVSAVEVRSATDSSDRMLLTIGLDELKYILLGIP
ncbi:unnamed protein product [Toxocara canis]|uniref:Uncharacterized protein n=1 Tax=Toxocara canis TaxID=6265 RepID=A0A183ULC1_TOXCA|nr:unnamed protein product [Toxocara canis]